MKISDLNVPISFKLVESRSYLYEGLDRESTQRAMLWESAGKVIVEFALTSDQINQIFQQAEQGMTGQGANRTMLGKGKDAATLVNKAYGELKTKFTNSKPVKDFDKKVSDILSKIGAGAKDPQFQGEVSAWVQKYRDFAAAHPIAQGAIYATLIAIAGLASGGVGIASLGLLKFADKMLQGERFSQSAIGGAETAALAGGVHAAAAGVDAVGNAIVAHGPGQGLPDHPSAASDYGAGTYDGSTPAGGEQFMGGQPGYDEAGNPIGPQDVNGGGQIDLPAADAAENTKAQVDAAQDWLNADEAGKAEIEKVTGMPAAQLQDIAVQNDLKPDAGLAPGEEVVPAGADANNAAGWDDGTAATGADLNQYTVMPGENLSTIAQAHGVSVADLMGLNPEITNPDVIRAGQTINIPPANGSDVYAGGTGTAADTASNVARGNYTTNPNTMTQAAADQLSGRQGNIERMKAAADAAASTAVRESYIDNRQTARSWMLRESLGRERGGVILTQAGINAVLFEEGALKKIGNWFKQKGQNITNKVTADKLKQAWVKAKMPNDSEQIAGILQQAGVGKSVIDDIYNGLGIPTTAQTGNQQQTKQGMMGKVAGAQGAGTTASGTTTAGAAQSQASATAPTANAEKPGVLGTVAKGLATGAASKAGDAVDAFTNAVRYGAGQGAGGRSLMAQHTKAKDESNSYTVKDRSGRPYTYTKRGDKWYDAQGTEVPEQFAASIEQAKKNEKISANLNQASKDMTPDEKAKVAAGKQRRDASYQPGQTTSWKTRQGDQEVVGEPTPAQKTTAPADVTDVTAKQTTQPTTQQISNQPTATPNFAARPQQGYSSVKMNAPTGVPQMGKLPAASPTMPQGASQPTARPILTPDQQKQQAAMKAKLQGQRQAGKTMATSTGGGFNQYKQAAQQKGLATAESKNFSAILWRQLKESK